MFLQLKDSNQIIKVLDFLELIDPNSNIIHGQDQLGQEEQEPDTYKKQSLVFPSGENLPRCWVDPNYRHPELRTSPH
ncbi:acetyltransferase [Umezakia ovalisporum]|uniref:Acetyltransferase n=1 Tax=Umezakia ovalisporum FSS-62 TaxID=2971776 RepID=A0AA43GX39_9CYAN|nr:acetyltransferase [Umezakia ovalisporum]MDH6063381.1 acetyltransferase [Umezakia ovalisporum FSS-62]MDH6066620.1 acetyltransferase [Umezakia ovalisporum APH033B]MDH6072801.1 acetyltransferase [Umezakia ovalisporum CS-1034]MDH6077040.1 acetyltransferase [Umezakia ovalisporum FSS-45]MDH6101892.1 acetyltransferase [Umezakia ovalisporum ANA283AFssAo]